MKRKKGFRPLIDLPLNSPGRKKYEEDFLTFDKIPGLPGCSGFACHKESFAILTIACTYPELLEIEQPKDMTMVYVYDVFNEQLKKACTIVAYHTQIHDDDQDHLECGWAITVTEGPESFREKIRAKAMEIANAIKDGNISQKFGPGG